MDEVTQQNAALVEEAAAAAQSLEDQAGALRTAVETFRLNDEATAGFSAIATPKAKARVTTVAKPVQKSAPKAAVRAPAAAPKLAATAGGDWETF